MSKFGAAFVHIVKKEYYHEGLDKIHPDALTKDVLFNCNHQRSKFASQDFTRCRSGRGGGLGKVDLQKVSEFGRIGFEQVRRRLAHVA